MKIVKGKEQEYKDWYEKNSDPYGRACFTYAERWAGMMEEKIKASEDDEMKVIVDNAKQLSYEADKRESQDLCMEQLSVFFLNAGNTENA